tara:strand:+ start:7514 stop:8785 length:1272 start_codon:yes stop_codon:yes gene_type:complete
MTIVLSANTPRISYTVNQGDSRTTFPTDFVFFETSDVNVFVDGVARTLDPSTSSSTKFTLSGGNGSTGTVTTPVTGATGGSTVVITRDVELKRTTDFPSSGAFEISKLNTELDTIITMISDSQDENSRAVRLLDNDDSVSLTLPLKADRAGTVLGFNATTGAAEAGPTIANVSSLSAITGNINTLGGISADITTVAHLEDGTTATSAVSGVASISTQVQGVNAISTEVQQAFTDRVAIQNASTNATKAENYAIKTDGAVESSNYSSKAWAIGGTGVTDTAGSGSAKEWATDTTNTCDGTEYSAKEYAIGTQSAQTNGSAKQWALGGGSGFDSNTAVSGGNYSAKYWALQAQASKTEFSNIYHGNATSDPSADPDGSALEAGDLYFNSSSNVLRVYNGSSWQDAAVDTTSFAGQGFAVAMAIAL